MNGRLTIAVLALLCAACSPKPPSQAEVEAFVRQYAAATRGGNTEKVMVNFSRDAGVVSVGEGKVLRGYDAIKSITDETIAAVSKRPVTVDSVDVTALGPDTALALVSMTITRTIAKRKVGTPSVGTLIVKRTPDGLRIVHEHYSVKGG